MTPLFFVIHFTSLLLVGPHVTMIVAAAGAAAFVLADTQRTRPLGRTLVNAATIMAALQTAGLVHRLLGGTLGHFEWPWQAAPIAAAVITYSIVRSASAEIAVPLLTGQPFDRSWPRRVLQDCPHDVIGAGIAVGLTEVVDHRMWEVLPVAAAPLYFAHRAYRAYVRQFEYEHRSLEAIESLDQGISVIDGNGRITLWNAALEEMVDCSRQPRARALTGWRAARAEDQRAPARDRRGDRRSTSQHATALWRAVGRWREGAAGADRACRRQHDAALARRHRPEARGIRGQAKRRAARARGRRRQRRIVGVGSSEPGILRLGQMARDDGPARGRGHRPSRGLDGSRPPGRDRAAQGGARRLPLRQGRSLSVRAPAPPRGRHVPAVPLSRCRGARRRPPGDPHRGIADRHDRSVART